MLALVTGGSRGIGKAIAMQLAQSGHDLFLVAKETEGLHKAAEEIDAQTGKKPLWYACDLRDRDAISVFLRDTPNIRPDVVVLCAGTFLEGSLSEGSLEAFNETLQVNLVANYQLIQGFVPRMVGLSKPRIVLIGSTAALESYHFGPLYGVSKWALRGFAQNLRAELKCKAIGVTLVNPGGTWTDLWAGEDLPPDRLLVPSDVASMVVAAISLSKQAVVEEIILRPMLGDMHQ